MPEVSAIESRASPEASKATATMATSGDLQPSPRLCAACGAHRVGWIRKRAANAVQTLNIGRWKMNRTIREFEWGVCEQDNPAAAALPLSPSATLDNRRRVIRRACHPCARIAVDAAFRAARGKRRGEQDVVDPKAVVLRERELAIVHQLNVFGGCSNRRKLSARPAARNDQMPRAPARSTEFVRPIAQDRGRRGRRARR